jgi:hypothetical protein
VLTNQRLNNPVEVFQRLVFGDLIRVRSRAAFVAFAVAPKSQVRLPDHRSLITDHLLKRKSAAAATLFDYSITNCSITNSLADAPHHCKSDASRGSVPPVTAPDDQRPQV